MGHDVVDLSRFQKYVPDRGLLTFGSAVGVHLLGGDHVDKGAVPEVLLAAVAALFAHTHNVKGHHG